MIALNGSRKEMTDLEPYSKTQCDQTLVMEGYSEAGKLQWEWVQRQVKFHVHILDIPLTPSKHTIPPIKNCIVQCIDPKVPGKELSEDLR